VSPVDYEKAKAQGRCGKCYKAKATHGVLCERCADRNRITAVARYRKRLAAGICKTCPKPLDPPHTMCDSCRVYHRTVMRLKYTQNRRNRACP
jgi:hypothetical protein